MKCPRCNHHRCLVVQTVSLADKIIRFRRCEKCGHEITTKEQWAEVNDKKEKEKCYPSK